MGLANWRSDHVQPPHMPDVAETITVILEKAIRTELEQAILRMACDIAAEWNEQSMGRANHDKTASDVLAEYGIEVGL